MVDTTFCACRSLRYLRCFKVAGVGIDEVYQWYTSLVYDSTGQESSIAATVNGTRVVVKESELYDITYLPFSGHRLEKCEKYTDLPLMCSKEEFWNTLTVGFNPRMKRILL